VHLHCTGFKTGRAQSRPLLNYDFYPTNVTFLLQNKNFLKKDSIVKFILHLVNKTLQFMKQHFLFPYWSRYLGWGLVIAHAPLTMIARYGIDAEDARGTQNLFAGNHLFFMCTALLMATGLFLVAFAKEKVEDEQIWQIRLDSLRWAIYVNYIILITSLVFINDTGHILQLNLWVPLLFFIIRFRWVIFRLNQSLSREG